jgi:hypothetical protein
VVTVKATYRTERLTDGVRFKQRDAISKDEFVKMYGYTFISGFQAGAEFIAVININAEDKSKIPSIKSQLTAAVQSASSHTGSATSVIELEGTTTNISVVHYGVELETCQHSHSITCGPECQILHLNSQ